MVACSSWWWQDRDADGGRVIFRWKAGRKAEAQGSEGGTGRSMMWMGESDDGFWFGDAPCNYEVLVVGS